MNIEDLKNYIDQRLEGHIHSGRGNDSKKISFNYLKNTPNFIYNPLTEDLDLNGNTINGGTLITGQTEIAELENSDKFLVSDNSGNLKYTKRENIGEYATTASSNTVFSATPNSVTYTFTVLFSGIINITIGYTQTGVDQVQSVSTFALPGEDISGSYFKNDLVSTTGTNYNQSTVVLSDDDFLVYAGTRIKTRCTGATISSIAVKYNKTLKTAPYVN